MNLIKAYKNADDQQKLLEPNKALMKAAAAGDIEAAKKIVLSGADIYSESSRRYCIITCSR
jgi:hypothetical protein